MSTAAVREFAQFFKEFLALCLSPDWPESSAEPEDVTKALEVAHHVQLAVNKMKCERKCFGEFLDLLNIDRNFTDTFLNNCLNHPSKFILKKILNSNAPVALIDTAFQRFKHLYSEDRLVEALSELIVEAASKETLLRNMSTMLPAHKVQELYKHLELFAILECNSTDMFMDTLRDCGPEMMDTLVLCLVSDSLGDFKRDEMGSIRRKIIVGFTNIMNCRDTSAKNFWEQLLNVDKDNLVEMYLKYSTLAEMTFDALGDRDLQIKADLPNESCYIQITEAQLHSALDMFLKNETLKIKFLDYMRSNGYQSCIPHS